MSGYQTTLLIYLTKTMLSPNSILHQGRYRITRHISENASGSLYEAHDNLFGQDVIIHEGPDPRTGAPKIVDRDAASRQFTAHFNRLRSLSHKVLVAFRDHFYHADRKYIVTEPVTGRSVSQLIGEPFDPIDQSKVIRGIAAIAETFEQMVASDRSLSYFQSDPANVRITPDDELKYLFFGNSSAGEANSLMGPVEGSSESPFVPLEVIWPGLDLASQKAISNSFDDHSLEVLESSPDFRSDIATLGSIAYFLITGALPNGALERSIEVLDGNSDPLRPPHVINPAVSAEFSDVVMRAMSLSRDDRFDGFGSFLHSLRSFASAEIRPTSHPAELFDESDLLEIPEFGAFVASAPVPAASPQASSHAARASRSVASSGVGLRNVDPKVPVKSVETSAADPRSTKADVPVAEREFVTLSPAPTYSRPESDIFSGHAAKKSKFFGPVAIGVVLLVIAAVGGWFALSTFTAEKASAVNQTDTRSTIANESSKPEPSPIAIPGQPVAVEQVSATPETRQPSEVSSETPATTSVGSSRSRPAVADTKPRVESKPTVSETGPKTKKKVTVDDLISDN